LAAAIQDRKQEMKIGIVVKADAEAGLKADGLEKWLADREVEVVRRDNPPVGKAFSADSHPVASPDLACVFVLGGDGTFLSAARWIADSPIPVLGVKFGEVGFLAEITAERIFEAAQAIIDKRFSTKARMRLRVRVHRHGRLRADETVLNDVVVNKGALARLARIKTFIDDHYLTAYRCDGLIVATPTGSTAYSLAAGGPIIHPQVPGIILTPICPFTLTMRPLIVPDSVVVTLQLAKDISDVMLTFDGQVGLVIDSEDQILVRRADHPLHMVSLPGQRYYDVVKTKLRWG